MKIFNKFKKKEVELYIKCPYCGEYQLVMGISEHWRDLTCLKCNKLLAHWCFRKKGETFANVLRDFEESKNE